MHEVKENRTELFDGSEITPHTRDVVSANILQVEAVTTGYKGDNTTTADAPISAFSMKPAQISMHAFYGKIQL